MCKWGGTGSDRTLSLSLPEDNEVIKPQRWREEEDDGEHNLVTVRWGGERCSLFLILRQHDPVGRTVARIGSCHHVLLSLDYKYPQLSHGRSAPPHLASSWSRYCPSLSVLYCTVLYCTVGFSLHSTILYSLSDPLTANISDGVLVSLGLAPRHLLLPTPSIPRPPQLPTLLALLALPTLLAPRLVPALPAGPPAPPPPSCCGLRWRSCRRWSCRRSRRNNGSDDTASRHHHHHDHRPRDGHHGTWDCYWNSKSSPCW